MTICYLIHRFGGDPRNLESAERWAARLTLRFNALFIVPWVPLCRYWPDSGRHRELGLEIDLKTVGRCDRVLAVCGADGKLSPGGQKEFQRANELMLQPIDYSMFETPEELEETPAATAGLALAFGRRSL